MSSIVPPESVLSSIQSDIKNAFPELNQVEFFYGDFDKDGREAHQLKTPAALLEVSEVDFSDAQDQGTGKLYGTVRFEMRLVFNFLKVAGPFSSGFLLSAKIASWLRLRLWSDPSNPGKSLPTGPAQPLGLYPDEFSPDLDKFKVWRIEWQQVLQFGDEDKEISDQNSAITSILLGEFPETGPENEGQYEEISGN